ncbi:carboxypeptidase [Thecamonas trahens ATCC 50062]|uniref:Carboxypeptidase n=1 Tax=Thecamonas trahens ATCC 50062 TaxID=461836 RepID=A0A0L0DKL2_THETB|nr:carboxypeptidase [Thecamonas trahens ATCC 50062]KNC51898.1 carboxypeptidase [Thecamonas trahens ATCC 50062]|eukprot:XP_013755755.1 carboxypeptidase [Thecamonas trahens ATCC 50062]
MLRSSSLCNRSAAVASRLVRRLASSDIDAQRCAHLALGRIAAVEPHPNADRLVVCRVEVAQENGVSPVETTIVCGAPNVVEGMFVPVALPGARLTTFAPPAKAKADVAAHSSPASPGPDAVTALTGAGKTVEIKLKKAKLRGVKSAGMMLSAREMGIDSGDPAHSSGLLDLSPFVAELVGSDSNAWSALDLGQVMDASNWLGLGSVAERGAALEAWSSKLTSYSSALAVLEWDRHVNMPPGAAAARAAPLSQLQMASKAVVMDGDIGPIAASLASDPYLAAAAAETGESELSHLPASARLALRKRAVTGSVSDALIEAESKAVSATLAAWSASKAQPDAQLDWPAFAPLLQEVIDVKVAQAAAVDTHAAGIESETPYDVALAMFNPGLKFADLGPMFFDDLAPALRDLVGRKPTLAEAPEEVRAALNAPVADRDALMGLCKEVVAAQGFDFDAGRLDLSPHPFTIGIHKSDVRITTRTESVLEALLATVHEAGHGLYEQGRGSGSVPYGTPASDILSVGIHESQAILYERYIGQSLPFWEWVWPKVQAALPELAPGASAHDAYLAANAPDLSGIRVSADELRYPLHIVLRTSLEAKMFNGELKAADLPDAWNEEAGALGIPEARGPGPLQDMHWAMGAFGYFPSYTLGAMYAAQMIGAASAQVPELADGNYPAAFTALKPSARR